MAIGMSCRNLTHNRKNCIEGRIRLVCSFTHWQSGGKQNAVAQDVNQFNCPSRRCVTVVFNNQDTPVSRISTFSCQLWPYLIYHRHSACLTVNNGEELLETVLRITPANIITYHSPTTLPVVIFHFPSSAAAFALVYKVPVGVLYFRISKSHSYLSFFTLHIEVIPQCHNRWSPPTSLSTCT